MTSTPKDLDKVSLNGIIHDDMFEIYVTGAYIRKPCTILLGWSVWQLRIGTFCLPRFHAETSGRKEPIDIHSLIDMYGLIFYL
jgi:hypothetical protein